MPLAGKVDSRSFWGLWSGAVSWEASLPSPRLLRLPQAWRNPEPLRADDQKVVFPWIRKYGNTIHRIRMIRIDGS